MNEYCSEIDWTRDHLFKLKLMGTNEIVQGISS